MNSEFFSEPTESDLVIVVTFGIQTHTGVKSVHKHVKNATCYNCGAPIIDARVVDTCSQVAHIRGKEVTLLSKQEFACSEGHGCIYDYDTKRFVALTY